MIDEHLHTLMTLGTRYDYSLFENTVLYKELYFLFSVSIVRKENSLYNLKKNQIILTSPIIDKHAEKNNYKLYTIIDTDPEIGLLLPIISWALEYTNQMLNRDSPVYVDRINGIVEKILLKIWDYEGIRLSKKGKKIDLLNSVSWRSIISGEVHWNNHDSLIQAEKLLKNNIINFDDLYIPHVHDENIYFFSSAGLCEAAILDLY